MNFWRDPDHELAAVPPDGNRFGHWFTAGFSIGDDLSHHAENLLKTASGVEASKLRLGDSAHRPTYSSSSSDHVTR